ncbi:MAG: hypothetical protein FWG98_09810 [Candidatus Cloacimonetes bacterium]|nr:hypothetical protein [Candidatus Cloacimonadota bacterium]
MMNKYINLIILLILIFSACQKSHIFLIVEEDNIVTKNTDIGDVGELRQVIKDAQNNNTIGFALNIHPIISDEAVMVESYGLTIRGSSSETMITRYHVSSEPLFSMTDGTGYGLGFKNLNISYINREVKEHVTLGGGLVSTVNILDDSGAVLGDVVNSRFTQNLIILENALHGGGLIGSNSNSGAIAIGNVDATFSNNLILLTNTNLNENGKIWGAGLVGVFADNQMQSPSIGNISGMYINNVVQTASYINGGGLVAAFVAVDPLITNPHTVSIGNVSADFVNNNIKANTNLSGGGLVGSWGWQADVEIGDVSGVYRDNIISAETSYLRGGGIIGLRSYTGKSSLGMVSASFLNNQIYARTYINGGIVGLFSGETLFGNRSLDKTSLIKGFNNASFQNNRIEVGNQNVENVYVLGSTVAVTGLAQELVVNNTTFFNNLLVLNGNIANVSSGTFYIGTDRETQNPEGHVLTLTASAGSSTAFNNNRLLINNVLSYKSITFSREYDSFSNSLLDSKADAKLNISPSYSGIVALFDPIKIDMNNNKIFTMNINGEGIFFWDSVNEFHADHNFINFISGTTIIESKFNAIGNYEVVISPAHTFRLNLQYRDPEIPIFSHPLNFTVQGTPQIIIVGNLIEKEYLFTNKRHELNESSFILTSGYELHVVGENLYMRRQD